MNAYPIPVPIEEINKLCQKWNVQSLAFFGSVLRKDFSEQSDIDILVRFLPEKKRNLFDRLELQDELSNLLGRKVDLVSWHAVEKSPNSIRRKEILDSAEAIYVAVA